MGALLCPSRQAGGLVTLPRVLCAVVPAQCSVPGVPLSLTRFQNLLLWAVIKPRLPFSIRVVTLSFQLIYLKIAGMLFPTSDFWHPVVTPALVCMSQLLTKVRPTGSQAGRSIRACGWLGVMDTDHQGQVEKLIGGVRGDNWGALGSATAPASPQHPASAAPDRVGV